MTGKIRLAREIVIVTENKIGVLADISKMLSDKGINISAIAGYNLPDGTAKVMLVSDDTDRAIEALKTNGHKPLKECEVVIVDIPNKLGALKEVTAKLAENKIDIKYIYGTAVEQSGPVRIIFGTNNNAKTVELLK
ncbi:MAG: hypothetical protein PHT95_06450 [Candidatus Omnitrophica bacterium]|jgi:hypothetical protein|nr:hypothetical protein [Candidatus Omnitrophota bacterium]MDD4013733.1 hypothetical protein [Candidatus Omnitrophota bacterium]